MGYTNYWQRPTVLPPEKFAAAASDCRALIPQMGIPLAGFDGTGDVVFDDDHISFNGRGGAGCEPFDISRIELDRRGSDLVFSFCKTQHRPYDSCVKAALVIFAHHLGDAIKVSSDGSDTDWTEARQIVHQRFGYGQDFRIHRG